MPAISVWAWTTFFCTQMWVLHYSQTPFDFLHVIMPNQGSFQTAAPHQKCLPWSFGCSLSHALLPCVLYWPQPVWEHNILVFFLALNLNKVLEKQTKTQCLLCQSQWHCSLSLTKAKLYSLRKKWNTDLPEFGRLGSFAAVNQIQVLAVCF